MNCCIAGGGDYEEATFYRDRIVTARKLHFCGECHEVITPGQRYELVNGMWGGKFGAQKTCLSCARIRDTYMCEGWVFGTVWEDLIEAFGEIYYDVEESDWTPMLPAFYRRTWFNELGEKGAKS